MDIRSLDKIVNSDLQYLQILSRQVDITCRSYVTKTNKMLNWGKTVFKVSQLRYFDRGSTKWGNICHKYTNYKVKSGTHSIPTISCFSKKKKPFHASK
jgi:hypothetical protein